MSETSFLTFSTPEDKTTVFSWKD